MIAAYILASFLDVHSSCMSINSGNREIILPFKTCRSIMISQSIIVPITSFYSSKFLKEHKKMRRAIFISAIISHGVAAIHNYRMIQK